MLIAIPSFCQQNDNPAPAPDTTIGSTQLTLNQHDTAIAALQSGRPTITGIPNYQSGIKINGVAVTTTTFNPVFASSSSLNYVAADTSVTNRFGDYSNTLSTLTITASGNYHLCIGGNTAISNTGSNMSTLTPLINGAVPVGFRAAGGGPWCFNNSANTIASISTNWRSPTIQAAGSVSVAMTAQAQSAGTVTIYGTSGTSSNANWWITECP